MIGQLAKSFGPDDLATSERYACLDSGDGFAFIAPRGDRDSGQYLCRTWPMTGLTWR
jgi:hypothetical protein